MRATYRKQGEYYIAALVRGDGSVLSFGGEPFVTRKDAIRHAMYEKVRIDSMAFRARERGEHA